MKNRLLKHFEKITSIPRCSKKTDLMFEELVRFAKEKGFDVFTDEYNNVLCKKGNPKICLQAHYDMVCLGDAPQNIEIVHTSTLLKAKNSTLGADDGMGMAIIFCMMEDYSDIECLFTNDEEVGLIGATNLKMELSSNKILNLDGESEEEIYIGCAGGIEIIATCKPKIVPLDANDKLYKISVEGLKGGHSGVDIDKHIPSAIKVLINSLAKHDVKLVDLDGGEMRNSIPKSAYAIVASKNPINIQKKYIKVEEYKEEVDGYFENTFQILHVLNAFAQGVREYEKDFMIPKTSINMGEMRYKKGEFIVECNARSLDDKDLDTLVNETKSLFELGGFSVQKADYHGAWKPDIAKFALLTKDIMSKYYKNVQLKAIHAGLECGALIQTQAKKIEAASIGPTIKYPHSLYEECDLNSVERIAYAVENIIQEVTK